jgi:hypothetical protein
MSANTRKETLERYGELETGRSLVDHKSSSNTSTFHVEKGRAKLTPHVISFTKEIDPRRERKLMKDRSREMLDAPWLTFALENTGFTARQQGYNAYDHMTKR